MSTKDTLDAELRNYARNPTSARPAPLDGWYYKVHFVSGGHECYLDHDRYSAVVARMTGAALDFSGALCGHEDEEGNQLLPSLEGMGSVLVAQVAAIGYLKYEDDHSVVQLEPELVEDEEAAEKAPEPTATLLPPIEPVPAAEVPAPVEATPAATVPAPTPAPAPAAPVPEQTGFRVL